VTFQKKKILKYDNLIKHFLGQEPPTKRPRETGRVHCMIVTTFACSIPAGSSFCRSAAAAELPDLTNATLDVPPAKRGAHKAVVKKAKAAMKKPAAAMKKPAAAKSKATKASKAPKASVAIAAKASEAPKAAKASEAPKDSVATKAPKAPKASLKSDPKNVCSRAYHQTLLASKKSGILSPEQCRALARQASSVARDACFADA
jgi:DNA polymerase III gamma/tau subunit